MTALAVPQSQVSAVPGLVARAKQLIENFQSTELTLRDNYDQLYRRAWDIGDVLAQLKEEIGHGKWMIWLPSHFQELGKTEEMRLKNAQRCIAFCKENPNSRNSSDFTADSIRKLMWGYIPAKERPQLPGDGPVTRDAHYLSFVNQFSKFDRQLKMGRVTLDVPMFQREMETPVRRIIELGGRKWIESLLASD
jgi:hypothetical protein